jgi:hypothetical protein
LLPAALARVLLTVDTDASTQAIVDAPGLFELAHVSTVSSGKRVGTKRYLFRLLEKSSVSREEAAPAEKVRN